MQYDKQQSIPAARVLLSSVNEVLKGAVKTGIIRRGSTTQRTSLCDLGPAKRHHGAISTKTEFEHIVKRTKSAWVISGSFVCICVVDGLLSLASGLAKYIYVRTGFEKVTFLTITVPVC